MNKILMTGLSFVVTKLLQGSSFNQAAAVDLTKLKLAKGYLESVKIFRLLSLSLLGAGACLVLLLAGIFLVHYTILAYAPWSIDIKVIVTLIFAAFYIFVAVAFFMYVFSEKLWLRIFNTDEMIKELTGTN